MKNIYSHNKHCKCGKLICNEAKQCLSCGKKGKRNPMYGIRLIGEKNGYYKGGKPKCKNCGIRLSDYRVTRCHSCENKRRYKIGLMNNSGKNHPQYKDGKGTEPYSPDFNNKLREEIRIRDHNKCRLCYMTKKEHFKKYGRNLEVHHKNGNRKDCRKRNLITTCKKCNIKERDTRNE